MGKISGVLKRGNCLESKVSCLCGRGKTVVVREDGVSEDEL